MQRRERRPLAVDIGRDHRQVKSRREKMQRHHDAVVAAPLLGVGGIHCLHDHFSEAPRECRIARNTAALDAQPRRVLNRTLESVADPEAERRHVVHEEVGEVLGRDHQQCFCTAVLNVPPLPVQGSVKSVALFDVFDQMGAPGDPGAVAQNAGVDQAHAPGSSPVNAWPAPVMA